MPRSALLKRKFEILKQNWRKNEVRVKKILKPASVSALPSEQMLTTKTEHALVAKRQIQMITSLQKTVEDKDQSLKELSDSLTSFTSESDSHSQIIKDKQTVIDSLKAKYLEIERRLKADQKKMIKIGEKEQQLNELRQSSKLKINSLQQRIRGLEAELAATTKQV